MSIHLWQVKRQYPDKSEAWYLTGCRNCAINYLKRGKSIDSKQIPDVKMQGLYAYLPNGDFEVLPIIDNREYESEIIASDLVYKIKAKLTAMQRKILDYLIDGFTEKEIGTFLKISQQAVSKHRRVIQQMAAPFLL